MPPNPSLRSDVFTAHGSSQGYEKGLRHLAGGPCFLAMEGFPGGFGLPVLRIQPVPERIVRACRTAGLYRRTDPRSSLPCRMGTPTAVLNPNTHQDLCSKPQQQRGHHSHAPGVLARGAGGDPVQDGVEQHLTDQEHSAAQDPDPQRVQHRRHTAGAQREHAVNRQDN